MALEWTKYPNFTPREFHCRCVRCKRKKGAEKMDPRVLEAIQWMRTKYKKAMDPSSGYRCAWNPAERKKKGGPGSHNRGVSVDVTCHGTDAYKLIALAIEAGFGRIGVSQCWGGPLFLHMQMTDKKQPRRYLYSY